MNVNSRKPIHNNYSTSLNKDIDQQIEDDSDSNGEELLNESYSDCSVENNSINSNQAGYKRRDIFDMRCSAPRTPQCQKPLATRNSPSPLRYKPESYKPTTTQKTRKVGTTTIIVAVSILAVILYYFISAYDQNEKRCSYEKLQKQYPQENKKLWSSLSVGVELILNKRIRSPVVYLFVHHGGKRVFELIKEIAKHSSSCFGPQMHPIEMESDDFIVASDKDYGYAIEKYKAKIKKGSVILIANLNDIPAKAARALHTICDTYSPIVKDVVIFLTLTIPDIVEGTVVSNAENALIELWSSKLERNELDPLITRVTDQVIALQS